jgi:hypothetical protein
MSFIQGHNGIKDNSLKSYPSLMLEALFQDGRSVFLIKKTEKLCSALYLVTGHLKDTEPLKSRVRSVGLDVLDATVALARLHGGGHEVLYSCRQAGALLTELSALFSILRGAGLVSSANADLVRSQFDQMSSVIADIATVPMYYDNTENPDGKLERNLASDFFSGIRADEWSGSMYSGQVGHDRGRPRSQAGSRLSALNTDKGYDTEGTQSSRSDKALQTPEARGERKRAIVDILRERGRANIKEVALLIADCSEKTIQRDINALIGEGRVERVGKKRWSYYNLTNPI